MTQQIAGFPAWELVFDEHGDADQATAQALFDELPSANLTDLVVFSHGWNNSRDMAKAVYDRFFGAARAALNAVPGPRPDPPFGVAAVFWPSRRWSDEAPPTASGGAAALATTVPPDAELVREWKAVFSDPTQRQALDGLADLLERGQMDGPAQARFQELIRQLVTGPDAVDAPEDAADAPILAEDPQRVLQGFGGVAPRRRTGGAAGIDLGATLLSGVKEAARAATYWEMKKRAGVVGKNGLGPLLGRLIGTPTAPRLHLIGHSFGARLVSFALTGVGPRHTGERSAVKSLMLIQGAFSHFAFAGSLPHDPGHGGALAGMTQRVDGPIVVSHSVHDTAVGKLYPFASFLSRDAASAAVEVVSRWGAMGADGAQEVNAAAAPFGPVGHVYPFESGRFLNLNGDALIRVGGFPSGAHSDIFYPEIAWAALAAGGIVRST